MPIMIITPPIVGVPDFFIIWSIGPSCLIGPVIIFSENNLISGPPIINTTTKDVTTDNIARPITNFEFEISINEEKREIDLLRRSYLQTFLSDLQDVLRYSRSSHYISGQLASTEITNLTS